jgi:acyl-CoA thioester hydrolase
MGHANTRVIAGFLDDAIAGLFTLLGSPLTGAFDSGYGWADVRHDIAYRRELRSGELVTGYGQVMKLGRTSVTSRHVLHVGDVDSVVCDVVTVRFNLDTRRPEPLAEAFLQDAAKRIAPQSEPAGHAVEK